MRIKMVKPSHHPKSEMHMSTGWLSYSTPMGLELVQCYVLFRVKWINFFIPGSILTTSSPTQYIHLFLKVSYLAMPLWVTGIVMFQYELDLTK